MSHESSFLSDVVQGLSQSPKQLNCKYFYDERGSQLFDQICDLEEYYLTRTESAILKDNASEIADQIDAGVMLIEPGSGSSTKTRILLEALRDPVAYVPVDISREHLLETAIGLRESFPEIEILPVTADFTEGFALPETTRPYTHAALFFPGSTIGNFPPDQAVELLNQLSKTLGSDGGLLVGVDLQKAPARIVAAYNDSQGVTAEFNLNILHRINRELGGDFQVDQFEHEAIYNEEHHRVELYVVSQVDQAVTLNGETFHFRAGERVFTEYSHKYTIHGFESLANQAGFSLHKSWTDENEWFALLHLVTNA